MRDFCLSATSSIQPATSQNEIKELFKEGENHAKKSKRRMNSSHRKWRTVSSYCTNKFCDGYCRVRLNKSKLKWRRMKLKRSSAASGAVNDCDDASQKLSDDNFIDTVFSLLEM